MELSYYGESPITVILFNLTSHLVITIELTSCVGYLLSDKASCRRVKTKGILDLYANSVSVCTCKNFKHFKVMNCAEYIRLISTAGCKENIPPFVFTHLLYLRMPFLSTFQFHLRLRLSIYGIYGVLYGMTIVCDIKLSRLSEFR